MYLLFQFVLQTCKTSVNARYLSGGPDLSRSLITGKREFDSDPSEFPVSKPMMKLTADYLVCVLMLLFFSIIFMILFRLHFSIIIMILFRLYLKICQLGCMFSIYLCIFYSSFRQLEKWSFWMISPLPLTRCVPPWCWVRLPRLRLTLWT